MRFDPTNGTTRLWKVLASPLERLDDAPLWGRVLAALGFVWQLLRSDRFAGAAALVVLCGVVDYFVGVRAATSQGRYDPRVAHAGAMGKMSGILLLLLVRAVEGWLLAQSFLDTKGGIATALAVSLIAVDLQSIAHHRETFGARPIPVISNILGWLQALAASRVPDERRVGPPDRREASDPVPEDPR
jgi:hypothetical protein